MDNRMGLKDFILIGLVIALMIMVALAMVQFDRQWVQVNAIRDEVSKQNQTLARLQDQIAAGVSVVGSSAAVSQQNPSQSEGADPFYRYRSLVEQPDYAAGDWVILDVGATVKNLTPLVSGDLYSRRIEEHVIESLVWRDPNTFEWKPYLAKSWEISEDGLTYTFDLVEDAVFADGQPVTAQDVVFSYEWIMNPKVAAPRARAYYEKVESVVAEGDHRVTFKFKEPYFLSMSVAGEMGVLAEHFYGRFTEDDFNKLPGLLFGSGPYQLRGDLKTWKAGTGKIELERNPNFWGPKPGPERIIWREISDDTARLAEFRNRQIDRFVVPANMYRQLIRDEDLLSQADLYEYEFVSSGYSYIGWNQMKNGKQTIFADQRVRLAMTLLIDRESIASRVFDNLRQPASGPFHPLGDQVDPELKPHPYDPDKAKALLKEAGYEDRDGDGVLESADGQKLSFKLIHVASSPTTKQMVLAIKDTMAAAGVDMQLDPLDWPIMQQKLDDRSFDAITLGWGGSIESDVYQMFHSKQIADGGDNYVSFRSDAADRLMEQARISIDEAERAPLWRQLSRVLHEEQPYTFLFNSKATVMVDKRLQNIQVTNKGLNKAWEYYVPAQQQLHTAN